ncbi:unnamed protein product [Caenorhabditis auriculariae]|uniref:CUE domain-containing protein n=1 Tax=Caenorhabditis auriculariae TaxID=2777116 RepID=A0A8S1GYW4_9PELO|nr:unnamed protein product [Caenorhabditis auriculariae]
MNHVQTPFFEAGHTILYTFGTRSSSEEQAKMDSNADEVLLDFETAMRDFGVMFPERSSDDIELALRRNDGDVAATIDALLTHQASRKVTIASETSAVQPKGLENLQKERKEVEKLLRENQKMLDVVCDVKKARELEDAQLALLLRHHDVCALIKREKPTAQKAVKVRPAEKERRVVEEQPRTRCPEGPVVEFPATTPTTPAEHLRHGLATVKRASRRLLSSLSTDSQ